MRSDDRQEPERTDPDPHEPDPETYNVAPPTMPPSPAGANADIGGEAAASRRMAGRPQAFADRPDLETEQATRDAEPFLGFDGMAVDDVLDWIRDADPEPPLLRRILGYERGHRARETVIRECRQRLQRLDDSLQS